MLTEVRGGRSEDCRPLRRLLRVVIAVVCVFIIFYGPLQAMVCLLLPVPGLLSQYFSSPEEPEAHGISEYEQVHFIANDVFFGRRLNLSAIYFPAKSDDKPCQGFDNEFEANKDSHRAFTVVVAHAFGSSVLSGGESNALSCAVKPLHCAGFNVLAVDMRNHGNSPNALPVSLGYYEADDILAAARWLNKTRSVPYDNIFFWGLGAGAGAASYAASQESRIRALVVVAAPLSLGSQIFAVWGSGVDVFGINLRMPEPLTWWFAWWYRFLSIDSPFDRSLLRHADRIEGDVLHAQDSDDPIVPFSEALALQTVLDARAFGRHGRMPVYREYFANGTEHCQVCGAIQFQKAAVNFLSEAAARVV